MKEKQIIRNQVYVVLLALLFIVTLGFAAVSAEASTSRDNRMEQVAAPVSVEAVFGSPFRIHKEFTLEFNANGGSGKQSAVFSSNGSIKLPECKYTKTGYHFTGWKIGSRVYSAGSDFPCDSYGSTTATAQWAANTYTVKYNANGGSGSMANTSATYGSSFNLRYNSFSRTGYSFAGWSCNGTNYSDHASVNNLTSTNGGSVTMYARWSPKSITIYFEDGGGYGTQSPIYTSYDSSVTLPVCSFARDGYHFTGWKINGTVYSAGSSISNPCTGGQVAATAQWAINTYTIAFSANGGSGSMASIPATYGTAITLPANGFSKTGSSFSGWTCNGTSYANKASVKNLTSTNGATVTMTAQWKANSYTIVFEANGGTGTQNVINTTYGATVTLPACSFARTGYRFAGWKINGKVYNAGDKVQNLCTGGQVAATAQWTPITYTIAFAANGGTGTMSSITVKYDETKKLPKCAFSKTGSTFVEWKWNDKTYANGASVKNLTSTNGATLTFTAQWKANSYTIVFEANGGTGTQNVINTTYGATVTLPACSFARTGYTFAGWKINKTVYKAGDKVKNLVTSGQVMATAQWKGNPYTITFAANGGTGTQSSISTTYGATVTLPACSFTRTGYTFAGWKINSKVYKAGDKVKDLVTSGKITATAQWTANTYTIVFAANGGAGSMSKLTVKYDETKKLPKCAFSKTGSTFVEWKWNDKTYANGASVKNLTSTNGATLTFTAQWKANSYTIVFEENGGTGTQNVINTTYGATVTLPACSFARTGYTFTGWKINGTVYKAGAKVKNLCTGGQVMATAQWKANTYTVTFMDGTTKVDTKTVTYGSTYGTLPVRSKSGCKDADWYTAASGGNKVTSATKVTATANHTLYARWIVNVKFDVNGGYGNIPNGTYTVGDNYNSLPAAPTAPSISKKFSGWYTEKEKGIKISTAMTVKATYTTLYAHWEPNKVSVTFDANGGTCSVPQKDVVRAENYGSMTAAKKPGNTFLGWFTQKSGGTRVEANTKVTATSNHTLYAHWEADSQFKFNKLLNPSGSSDEPNPFEQMAHNIYCYPGLSPEEKKVGFTGFVIDFYTDREAVGTYWALCNWRMNTDAMQAELKATSITQPKCYAGLQFTTDNQDHVYPKSNIAFWQTEYVLNLDKEHPKYINARDKLVFPNSNISYFGGEGEGRKYLTTYNWSPNKWYRMYIECYDDADGYTLVSQYIQDVSTGKWTTICTVNTNLKHSYFVGDMSQFMEDYRHQNSNLIRTFGYRNIYVKKRNGGWKFISSATLSTDDNSNKKGVAALGCSNTVLYGITCGYGSSRNSDYANLRLVCPDLSSTLSSSSPVLPPNRHNK